MLKNFKERMASINVLKWIMFAMLVWFIIAFLIYPNINLLIKTFFGDGSFSTDPFIKLMKSNRALKSLSNSFILAISLAITVNVVGIFLVFVTDYYNIKGANILRLGFMSTLVYSGIVLVSGYQFIYGSNGIITKLLLSINPGLDPNWFTGYFAVLYIMTFACTSNHMIFLSNAIRKIDYQTIEAARNMGASDKTILLDVVLPVLKPTLFAITVLTFLTGLGAVSAPLIVGGKDFQTINPMILLFAKTTSSRDIAALLAIILGLATFILLAIMSKVESGGNYISISKVKSKIKKQNIRNPFANAIVHFFAYLLFLIYIIPITLIILFSFTDSHSISKATLSLDKFTLNNYISVFTKANAYKPYIISILYSLGAAVLVAIICLIASRIIHRYKKSRAALVLEFSLLIPWLLPSTLIALGLMLTYDSPKLIMGNNVLLGTPWILLFAYIIIKIPFSLRLLKAAFFSVEGSMEEAAKSMGAGAMYTFRRVILPLIFPFTLAVVALNFNNLLADYDLTVFLYHPLLKPLGVVIKESTALQATGDTKALTLVYSVILMIISTIMLYLIYGRKKSKR